MHPLIEINPVIEVFVAAKNAMSITKARRFYLMREFPREILHIVAACKYR